MAGVVVEGNQVDSLNEGFTNVNVFEYLSEDAMRRKREQELMEAKLNQHQTFNLVSENSIKILYKRILHDFNNSIF